MWEVIVVLTTIIFLCFVATKYHKRYKNQTSDESNNGNYSNTHIQNEEWVTYDSSQKLVEEIYQDQVEGIETTSAQQDQLKKIWNSGRYSGHFSRDRETSKISPFDLHFSFQNDTVVGYGQEEFGEFLICGYFNPYNNRLAFRQEFMCTPGGDNNEIMDTIDFQLKWQNTTESFIGHYYIQSKYRGTVYLKRM